MLLRLRRRRRKRQEAACGGSIDTRRSIRRQGGHELQAGRGAQYFGKDADFAEHILNTDDIVPNTEVPLPLCYCLDVTGAKERKSFPPPDKTGDLVYDFIVGSLGGHSWPMGYLARHYETKLGAKGQLLMPSHEEMPRGTVVRVA